MKPEITNINNLPAVRREIVKTLLWKAEESLHTIRHQTEESGSEYNPVVDHYSAIVALSELTCAAYSIVRGESIDANLSNLPDCL